jgi:DNA-binding MarR family transcriptional regulator
MTEKDFDAQGEIVAALRRIIRAVDLHSKYLAQHYGLTGPQLVVLQYLDKRGPVTTNQLAEGVSLGQATLSNILERLSRKGLIERRRSREDKRQVINELSDSGRDAIKVAPPLLQERFAKSLRGLASWEQTLILSTLQRVAEMMHAEKIDASPVLVSGPVGVSAEETADFLTTDVEANRSGPSSQG